MKHSHKHPVLNGFEDTEGWKDHWKEMPEFVQNKQEPYAQIIFRVDSKEDLNELARVTGQKLTKKTKSAWFPPKSHWGLEKKIYKDEP